MGDRRDALSWPPGDDWTAWEHEPPRYKPRRVVELWREEWQNDTAFICLDQLATDANGDGLWWREA